MIPMALITTAISTDRFRGLMGFASHATGSFERRFLLRYGIGGIPEALGMVTLGANHTRQRAAKIISRPEKIERRLEVIPRPPAQFPPRTFVDVYAIDARIHSPAVASIGRLVTRNAPFHDCGRVDTQVMHVIRAERRRRADNVSAITDC